MKLYDKMFNSMDEVIVVNQGSITNPVSAGNVYLTSNPTLINIVVFVSVITQSYRNHWSMISYSWQTIPKIPQPYCLGNYLTKYDLNSEGI